MASSSSGKSFWLSGWFIFILITGFLIMFAGYGFYMWKNMYSCNPAAAGQFGDMFGAATAFFSSLTLVLLIYSIIMQRTELNNTIREMKESNDINAAQLSTNIALQETAKLQRVENTLFRMIERLQFAREVVRVNDGQSVGSWGEEEFKNILYLVNAFFFEGSNDKPTKYEPTNHKRIAELYNNGDQRSFNTKKYFQEFDNIFELLFHSDLPLSVQRFYIKILRTYLNTEEEMILLYYHLGFRYKFDDPIRKQIEASGLFDKINKTLLPDFSYNDVFFHIVDATKDA